MDCSLPGSSLHGILQARVLEWGAIAFSDKYTTMCKIDSCIEQGAQFGAAAAAKLLQLCLTLCDPTEGSPPGSPVPGILQARVLEWGAIAFSIRLFKPP